MDDLTPPASARNSEVQCLDCRIDTLAIDEDYWVHDTVWMEATGHPYNHNWGRLCVGCLEARLHRRLMPEDFSDVSFYEGAGSARLLSRQSRQCGNPFCGRPDRLFIPKSPTAQFCSPGCRKAVQRAAKRLGFSGTKNPPLAAKAVDIPDTSPVSLAVQNSSTKSGVFVPKSNKTELATPPADDYSRGLAAGLAGKTGPFPLMTHADKQFYRGWKEGRSPASSTAISKSEFPEPRWVCINDVTWKLTDGIMLREPVSDFLGSVGSERALAWVTRDCETEAWPPDGVQDAVASPYKVWFVRVNPHFLASIGHPCASGPDTYGPVSLETAKTVGMQRLKFGVFSKKKPDHHLHWGHVERVAPPIEGGQRNQYRCDTAIPEYEQEVARLFDEAAR